MHNYELIESTTRDAQPRFRIIEGPRWQGELVAARYVAAKYRAIYDEMGDRTGRQGQHGDDPVEVYGENAAQSLEYELIGQLLLSAEGAVRMAELRLADWNRKVDEWLKTQDHEVEGSEA